MAYTKDHGIIEIISIRFDGQTPSSPVSFDPAGNLYGTTQGGGANGYGAVYKLFK